jgi:hypothetical protein
MKPDPELQDVSLYYKTFMPMLDFHCGTELKRQRTQNRIMRSYTTQYLEVRSQTSAICH